MAMANGATILHGEFTPESDVASYTIDPGREVSMIFVQCKSGELISGVRNTAYIGCTIFNGQLYGYGLTSNLTGTNWGGNPYWSKISGTTSGIIDKNGTAFTFKPQIFSSSAKFYSSRTYEWFAI